MNWIRAKFREWLGVEIQSAKLLVMQNEIESLQNSVHKLEGDLFEFRAALKARAAQVPQRPVYTDYESSQQAVLAEFEEKNNGV